MVQFEETNAGVRKKGEWKDVAEFSRKVKEVMNGSEADGTSVKRFGDWRPKKREAENDMKQKTIEKASVEPEEIDKDEIRRAGEKAKEAGEKAVSAEDPTGKMKEASSSAAKPFYSGFKQFFSRIEKLAYDKLILRSRRWYFDSEDLAADMKSCRDGEYQMEVNVLDREERERLREELQNE
ncbi:MAG: DUF5828 family protein [Candidatus Nanohaloarchaea archaeon]